LKQLQGPDCCCLHYVVTEDFVYTATSFATGSKDAGDKDQPNREGCPGV